MSAYSAAQPQDSMAFAVEVKRKTHKKHRKIEELILEQTSPWNFWNLVYISLARGVRRLASPLVLQGRFAKPKDLRRRYLPIETDSGQIKLCTRET